MSGLLATEAELARSQLFQHISVADTGGANLDPGRAHGQVQPEVAHHGRDQGVAGQLAGFLHRQRQDHHDGVAVDDLAGGVDRQAAIGVAVVGQSEVGAVLEDR